MNKSDLVKEVARRFPHASARDIEIIVNVLFAAMTAELQRGGRVELRGFGSLSVRRRRQRDGRNPKTGESVGVPAKRVPFFTAGHALRERLNRMPAASETIKAMSW